MHDTGWERHRLADAPGEVEDAREAEKIGHKQDDKNGEEKLIADIFEKYYNKKYPH